jgi:ribosomal protein S18 acetylase RimI-like enzyme
MSVAWEQARPILLDLRQIRVEDIDPLLEEETGEWARQLDWDFRPSADLVRRFVRMQALNGYVLAFGRRPIGYCYYVCEDGKGLIGDIYVLREFACPEYESQLLTGVLRAIFSSPHLGRVESQLMMISGDGEKVAPFPEWAQSFRRNFMMAELSHVGKLPPGPATTRVQLQQWHEREQEESARLIARAYREHVDAEINDQYRSVSGARRFLSNIVQYPGCGSFFQPGSCVAIDPVTDRLVGLSLASLVAFDVGHITQVCVDPSVRGSGIGYELMRHSLVALAQAGCRCASLTVTGSNQGAVGLYERLGFRTIREFDAVVWNAHKL